MNKYDNIWNPFGDDSEIAVVCPEPENLGNAYMRLLARKFGRQIPGDYALGVTFLYGQKSHGSSNHHDHDEDAKARESGEKYFIPKWLTNLSWAFGSHYAGEVNEAYKRGKAHGKNLLARLASGDMTVLDFEDHRS